MAQLKLGPRYVNKIFTNQTSLIAINNLSLTGNNNNKRSTSSVHCSSNPTPKRQQTIIASHNPYRLASRQYFLLPTQCINSSGFPLPPPRQQNRDFQTSSRCFHPANDPTSNILTKSTVKFSEASTDILEQKRQIFGGLYEGHPIATRVNENEVCTELQNERFTNHRLAFASKSTFELARSMFFFFLFRFQMVTDHSERIMHFMKNVLGERMSDVIMKKMIYDQFVAGETNEEIRRVVSRLQKDGVGPLIAVPIEDDIAHSDGNRVDDKDEIMDGNCAKTVSSIDLCMDLPGAEPMFQIRMSALVSPELAQILSKACDVNESGDSDAISMGALRALVQGIQGKTMEVPKTKEWDVVMAHKEEFQRALKRLRIITEKIVETGAVGMVDAEYTYFNPAIRHLSFAMMEICSKNKPLVFYTYQAYLKKTYGYLVSDLKLAKSRGICFGAKLVRGAYIVKERSKAKREGYPDPVNDSFEATSDNYHRCLDELMLTANENEDRIRFIIASHNEDSVRYAFKRMSSLGLPVDSKAILFGQLYGMADHVSFTLGKYGVNIVKSLPIGSIEDTIPYLSRRAQENRSIFDNVRNEKRLVKKALRERIFRAS